MSNSITGFFAYPSKPAILVETICNAVKEINKSKICNITTWQNCSISGNIIIDVICRKIESSDLFLVDLTEANPNVLFELGYAIAKQKRIWALLDTSRDESKTLFDQLKILTTLGYTSYTNASHIVVAFYREKPWETLNETIYKMSIEPALNTNEEKQLLYLRNQHLTEPARHLDRIVESYNLPTSINDPAESSVQSLVWYATKIWQSIGVIAHLAGVSRHGSQLHNDRYAFVSGLAHGFERPLLMLVENDYISPIDYRDILQKYETAFQCSKIAKDWLLNISDKFTNDQKESDNYVKKLALAKDLKTLNVGEYLAENEERILPKYFVETQAFLSIINDQNTVIVGQKGSGKTANLYMAANRLREDKRNLVCVIKPASYDFQGVVRLVKQFSERDKKGYLSESLWKLLLLSEIANTIYAELKNRPYASLNSQENDFLEIMEKRDYSLKENFAVRLETCVDNLISNIPRGSLGDFQGAISEILHGNVLQALRKHLGNILSTRKRITVLIDNLDKAWERKEDIEHLSYFLFGLIRVSRDITKEFARHDNWRKKVNISITIFLRSDIFIKVVKEAREPDKIPYVRLSWDDPDTLMRVLDERLAINRGVSDIMSIWQSVFCSTVNGIPSREYILNIILPRPRDLIYFTKSALSIAVNRGHTYVEEVDIHQASKQYSQFVFEVIQVENGISLPDLEAIMFEFVGRNCILTKEEVLKSIAKSGLKKNLWDHAISHLISLYFLGVEINPNEFRYCTNSEELRKLEKLSELYAERSMKAPCYRIHNAFHAYLEVSE